MSVLGQSDPSFEIDERIFHYTNAKGLYGILHSKCLWATHFQFLNDSREFITAYDTLIEHTSKRIHRKIAAWSVNREIEIEAGETTRTVSQHEARKFVDQFYETSFKNFGESYVLSGFCCKPTHEAYQNGGQLHWATYGRQGGYAIRINPHKLYSLISEEEKRVPASGFVTGKVAYSTGALHDRFKNEFDIFAEVAAEFVEENLKHKLPPVEFFRAIGPFHQITSLLKDSFFCNEEEARVVVWRIAHPGDGHKTYTVDVRHIEGLTIPYIEMFRGILFQPINPVEAIIVGPHPKNELRLTALRTYLRSAGLDSIEVIESNVPYVG